MRMNMYEPTEIGLATAGHIAVAWFLDGFSLVILQCLWGAPRQKENVRKYLTINIK